MEVPPTGDREELLDSFNRVGRRGSAAGLAFSSALAQHLGLDRTAVECLDVIAAEGPVSAGRLGELTGLSSGAVTGLVDRLAERGLVERRPDPADRRRLAIRAREPPPPAIRAAYGPLWSDLLVMLAEHTDAEIAAYLRISTDLADLIFAHAARMREAG